jgi:hypothetical protein
MNQLERALLDLSNNNLDFYLEVTPTVKIREDIEDMRSRQASLTDAGRIRERLREIVREFDI